ncbi:hypothetical protein FACS189430_07000 [Bacteroidia bacterium]|nr:hypothetical protein FACS189430_07000 [Bacteroidia bacterium]
MKGFWIILIWTVVMLTVYSCGETQKQSSYRNFYGITWEGKPADNLSFAKQMGYEYIMYAPNMENDENATNIRFYLESPEYSVYPVHRSIYKNKTYSEAEKEAYSKFAALKDASLPFPDNLASGWFFTRDKYSVEPDFQQQKVIDEVVEKILDKIEHTQRLDKDFIFGGFCWDVPNLTGDFYNGFPGDGGRMTTLRGVDSGYTYPGTTHEYSTYSDGRAMYYKTLFKKTREKYPDAKFIVEPSRIYDNWIKEVSEREDVHELTPDLLLQESSGNLFITDERIHTSGLADYSKVGCSTPDVYGEDKNREIAAIAAVHGSFFGWYGRFGGTGNMPQFKNVYEVPARLLLVRVIPGWENLHETPLKYRKWSEGVYSSPTAYISEDLIYAVQPKTKKIFVVFNSEKGKAKFNAWKRGLKVYRTNGMLIEEEITEDILVTKDSISLRNASGVGQGYIIK